MTRIAVIGAGAIGGTLAAWLARTHDVTVCARTPLADLEIETPGGAIRATPTILTDPAAATPVDWVLSTTKTYDCAAAAAWLPGLMGADTRLAVIQNGVEQRDRFPMVPPDRTVPVIIDLPAERTAPGRIVQRRDGTILVPEGADGSAFVALFADTVIAADTTPDFVTAAWRKLAINCSGIVSAITRRAAEVANDEGVAEVMRGLVRECILVGRAEGATLPDKLADQVVEWTRKAHPDSVNSLHADFVAGRPMELDARNGVIVRLGARHGIPTPLNAALAALLAASHI
ncbi:2-dehydropantoate 2-reductase [Sphingomonas psychrotolerans]|uniref:2-dehydropantoate 2-reductase n=1 Tax=Sphingomonas psychrotolerans TaxID=1327635 RepID=A0ABU3MYQ5_9SPHN|nr:2-dehydropantoate 2-reductase [Sphingomonas psychrotolerans]MDT8757146.1 2-dehydropantoate 2-reductase [Sphingomonas psychrotolerans]